LTVTVSLSGHWQRIKPHPFLFLLCLLWAYPLQAGTLSVIGPSHWVNVSKVIDGDTFYTSGGEKVRLLGINAPEVTHHTQPGQPLGKKATQRLRELISGQSVKLVTDRDKQDRYGRTLAQIYLRNGLWVNRQLISEGLAQVYTFTPNVRDAARLLKAEREARLASRGMWHLERFRVLESNDLTRRNIGQFRVIRGVADGILPWRFRLGKLIVTVPRKERGWFQSSRFIPEGRQVIIRGIIRASSSGQLYLALHSPYDIET